MNSLKKRLGLALVAALMSGCAVVMATKQPSRKNLDVLRPGTERDYVIAELGVPATSEKFGDGKKEIYIFVQGYSKGAKAARAIFHGAADVFTVGIWEVVGTPLEGTFDGKKITVRVLFDAQDKIRESTTLAVTNP
jgi:outer membrane protein assembly factor BamE (lipoprotein component of BamABCDE complex)